MHQSLRRIPFSAGFLKVVILAVFSICVPSWIQAQGTYPKIEASFTVNTPIADPFDYSNDVRVLIVQPDSSTVSLPAFFDGGTTWRVRHMPAMAGAYSVSGVTLNGSAIVAGNLQPGAWTVAGPPTDAGFVRVEAYVDGVHQTRGLANVVIETRCVEAAPEDVCSEL